MEVEKSEDRRWCVYIHTNIITNKAYIGITSNKPEIRWKNGEGYKDCSYFYNAIQKYGWDNFEHIIWMSELTKNEAYKIEQLLIALFDTTNHNNGYNLSTGGQLGPIGVKRINETKEKLRLLNTGVNNPNYGLKRSEETKRKMSEARKGKPSNNPLGLKGPRKYVDENGNALYPQICQYTKDGILINKFFNSYDASSKTGISRSAISNCLCGLSKTAGGYIWKKEDDTLTQDDIILANMNKRKKYK